MFTVYCLKALVSSEDVAGIDQLMYDGRCKMEEGRIFMEDGRCNM